MLIVADGAPGLIKAIEQCWPVSDRQRCCVHRARNLYAKLPESERERVKHAYWQALDDAINERDAKDRLQAVVDELGKSGLSEPGFWSSPVVSGCGLVRLVWSLRGRPGLSGCSAWWPAT